MKVEQHSDCYISPNSSSSQERAPKKKKEVPLQERIMHMKKLNVFPLVKVSHLYYHQLLKLARLQRLSSQQLQDINQSIQNLFENNQQPKNTATKTQLQLCIMSILNPQTILDKFNDYSDPKRKKDDNWQEICQTIGLLFKKVNSQEVKTCVQLKLLLSLQIMGLYILGVEDAISFKLNANISQKSYKNDIFLDNILNDQEKYTHLNQKIYAIQQEFQNSKQQLLEKMRQNIKQLTNEENKQINDFMESIFFQI
ncbi:hypothetical protein TTHERM_00526500 (macronuclear) [Tetrahymena thermophila SB210]|uniref:Uncharacterized protein n=1 Tax=Tetrahymena thermophila (strain SB210) TaxID=312017 RepID=I7LY71_TETTS|nr:hypothetical protein TTHERM_00526500 [Tetrahymena thermophila SB210]EAS07819.2 hypothetical protein TTHERM_00526500 [Tetrahymena thermophila SB210]|eukprot:XP_001028061.2 hypothetical protein TTHERM_00526500 [Tetrahymena thermophila SB210]